MTAAPTAILAAKRRLRARALGRRDAAASGAEGADAAAGSVRDRFFDAFAAELGRTPPPAVSGYWPMQGELDVLPLLSGLCGRGIACALPAVIERGAALAFRAWRPGDGLVAGVFGTREPAPEAAPVIPGIVIAPLLAFDEAGNRLGYGGGYYDRTLEALRAAGEVIAVGVAYEAQRVEAVPHAGRDQPLDWVVTERRAIAMAP